MTSPTLRIHHRLESSRVNGPGNRAVIWLQGCTLGCPGCFNPETHGAGAGQEYPVEALVSWLAALPEPIDGLSISGGEPLQQIRPLVDFLRRVKQNLHLPVLLFTGYAWEEMQKMPAAADLLGCVDVVIAGRYLAELRLADHLIGSANKTVHFITNLYTMADLNGVPQGEIVISSSGTVTLSGIDPLIW